jgi:hypothetical protein
LLGDPFEGAYPKHHIEMEFVPLLLEGIREETIRKMIEETLRSSKEFRRYIGISSWCVTDWESAAMWNLYVEANEGIAVQSTLGRLKKSFDVYLAEYIYIGEIKYINYEKEWIPYGSVFYPFLHKRKSYEYEHELRAIIIRMPTTDTGLDFAQETFDSNLGGAYINVDLDTLIQRVYVSPSAPNWFGDLVSSVMKRYSIEKPVQMSSLVDLGR